MTLLVCYIILIVLNLKFSKSKFLYYFDFFYMWVLMGWNYSVADYDVYFTRYTHPEIYGTLEPLYVILQNFGKLVGLSYNQFLACLSFVFLLTRMILIKRMSVHPNYVIGLYLLFPFIMDVTQIRMFYATTFVLAGIYILQKKKKHSNLLFLLFVILASMIHSACIIYLVVLIAQNSKKINEKKYLQISVLVCLVLYAFLPTGILYGVLANICRAFGFGRKFIETTIATSKAYKITHKITYMIEILIFFFAMAVILQRAKKSISHNYSVDHNNVLSSFCEKDFLDLCSKINYSLLISLPLAWFSGDIYRVQHAMTIIFYIAVSNSNSFRSNIRGKVKINQSYIAGFIVVFMFLFLIGIPSLRETVFVPVFFNNELIG